MVAILLVFLLVSSAFSQECRVETREVVRAVYGSGRVKADKYVLLRSGVSGYIKRVRVSEGEEVKKGDILVEIEDDGLSNRINSLRSKLQLVEDRMKPDSPFMKLLESRKRMALENLRKVEKAYKRRKSLFEKGIIPREDLERAEREFLLARDSHEVAVLEKEKALRDLEFQRKSLKEEIRSLEKKLSMYRVKSPIDGEAIRVFVEEGDFVNHMSMENRLVSVGSGRKVVLEVDEELSHLLRVGQTAYLDLEALGGKIVEGEVVKVGKESDPTRRVVEVEVKADIPSRVPLNSLVEGNVVVDRLKTTVVPLEFVKGGRITLIVEGEKRTAKVRRVFERYAEVVGFPAGTPCTYTEDKP